LAWERWEDTTEYVGTEEEIILKCKLKQWGVDSDILLKLSPEYKLGCYKRTGSLFKM